MSLQGARYDLTGQQWGLIRRVSTGDQVENYRFQQQELRTRTWLEELGAGVRLFDENVDGGGKSGRDLDERPVAREALDRLEAGELRGIAGLDFARLSRDEYGVDAGTMFERVANAKGRIAADRRIYDPRDARDLDDLRRLAAEAGRHMLTIRDQFWDGIFGKAEEEPFFQGLPPFGYAVRHDVVPDPRGRRKTPKIKPVPIKNAAHAEAMADLIELLDACDSKGAVVKRWNAKWGALAVAHAAKSPRHKYGTGWATSKITDMLSGDVSGVYTGVFAMGRRAFGKKAEGVRRRKKRAESTVWDPYRDRLDELVHVVDGVSPCPCGRSHADLGNLSYWTAAQARAWAEKFDGGTRKRETKHTHLLKGILSCAHCHQPLVGGGRNGYSCPQRQHGVCKGQHVGEGAAWRGLRELLPTLLEDARRYAELAAEEVAGDREASLRELLSRRTNAQARVDYLSRECYGDDVDLEKVPEASKAALVRAEGRVKALDAEIAAERARVADAAWAQEVAETVARRPVEVVEALPPPKRAELYRRLVRGVEIVGEGSGSGRTWRVQDYVSLARAGAGISGGMSSDALAYLATALQAAA